MELEAKLKTAIMSGVPLTLREAETVREAFDLLRRIADNMCTNPTHEARNILGHTR